MESTKKASKGMLDRWGDVSLEWFDFGHGN